MYASLIGCASAALGGTPGLRGQPHRQPRTPVAEPTAARRAVVGLVDGRADAAPAVRGRPGPVTTAALAEIKTNVLVGPVLARAPARAAGSTVRGAVGREQTWA
jgi:hypothetical protein